MRPAGPGARPWAWLVAGVALLAIGLRGWLSPFPPPGQSAVLDLIAYHDPALLRAIRTWYHGAPAAAVFLAASVAVSGARVWMRRRRRSTRASRLPPWPISEQDDAPSIVVGELHGPTRAAESQDPSWLVIPEKGLYTGVLIVGAVGAGKTTSCMYPFAKQLLSWQATDPTRRAAALVLEVKGDFCHQVHQILADAGREDDYLEIGLGGRWRWNPLDAPLLDSYSLAYSVASLINQLFGKGREPFWQQAYTNLVRWIIELHRLLPEGWVTLRDIYRCTIDEELLAQTIARARRRAQRHSLGWAVLSASKLVTHAEKLQGWPWQLHPDTQDGDAQARCRLDEPLRDVLDDLGLSYRTMDDIGGAGRELHERVEAVERWHRHDWLALDAKLRTSIVEGLSVFLSLFDQPQVARIFCPQATSSHPATAPEDPGGGPPGVPGLLADLPSLGDLIDEGRVLALNMPAGANPALARAIGVMLKNAWLQTLLRRPAEAARHPGRTPRPAVFICDEYQAFATVGQDDPSGDEKAFALTRQCRCIPIVATQSISSLRSALPDGSAWRTLVQTLRTRIFLALSDDASARVASDMCGTVLKSQPSYTLTETTGRPEFSLLSGRAGGGRGSIGTSKSFRRGREAVFSPRDFFLLPNYQAVCLPYDGAQSLPATRVYLKPHYLPREESYWRQREDGRL